jgi:membrane protease YdiL (CAAX protease family)
MWFAVLAGVFIPFTAVVQARAAKSTRSRQKIKQRLKNTLLMIAFAALAYYVAGEQGIYLFSRPVISPTVAAASLGSLVAALVLAEVLLTTRSEEAKRRLWVNQIIPRTPRERVVWVFSSIVAGITEEMVFRGVLFVLLAAITGSILVGALASALAFAVAHAKQGRRTVIFVGAIALVFQGLAVLSSSLIPAMAVHAIYNIVRGLRASRALGELSRLPA